MVFSKRGLAKRAEKAEHQRHVPTGTLCSGGRWDGSWQRTDPSSWSRADSHRGAARAIPQLLPNEGAQRAPKLVAPHSPKPHSAGQARACTRRGELIPWNHIRWALLTPAQIAAWGTTEAILPDLPVRNVSSRWDNWLPRKVPSDCDRVPSRHPPPTSPNGTALFKSIIVFNLLLI